MQKFLCLLFISNCHKHFNYFERFINHFKTDANIFVTSSPYLGIYKKETFQKDNSIFEDNDIFYYSKNSCKKFSRIIMLEKALYNGFKKFQNKIDSSLKTLIFITQPNLSYLKTAIRLRHKIKNSKIVCFVPDLTIYSNLSTKSFLVRQMKKMEQHLFNRLENKIDAFIYFSKHMNSVLNKQNKPYIVLETILPKDLPNPNQILSNKRSIVYTGTLNIAFGIKEFIETFKIISKQQKHNIDLIIAGSGEYSSALKNNKNHFNMNK